MGKKFFLILIIIAISFVSFLWVKNSKKPYDDRTKVVFWTLQLGTFDKYINSVISQFEKENPDIRIQWIDVPYSEGEKRVLASLLSNVVPDLVNITADFSVALSQKSALEIISAEEVRDFNPQIMKMLQHEDGYSSFPFYATSSITVYNESLLKKAGIGKVPSTFEELNGISAFTKERINVHAQMPTLCENDTFLKILNKYGIDSAQKLESASAQNLFNEYKALYQKNYIPNESITQTHREVLEKYGAGQIIVLQAGANFLNIIKENSPNVYKNTNVAHQLTGTTGKYDYSLMNLAIPKKAQNKDAAKKFALFLLNRENQLEFSRLTAILPVNSAALKDDYFKNYAPDDIIAKARVLSASQMNNLQNPVQFKRNQKEIINLLNLTTQEIMLDKVQTEIVLHNASEKWAELGE